MVVCVTSRGSLLIAIKVSHIAIRSLPCLFLFPTLDAF